MKKRLLAVLMTMVTTVALTCSPAFAENMDSGVRAAASDSNPLLTIYYTNDVHSYIDGELSYATIAELKDQKEEAGENVMLVDAGDHIQGTAYGAMDKGKTIIELMNESGYDIATLGNHEFDYGMEKALGTIDAAEYPYVSCNFVQDTDRDGKWENVLDSYKIYEYDGVRIAYVGITTPQTLTSSTPKYFQDDKGNYIYDFCGDNDGSALYHSVQSAVDNARDEGADYVIGLAHLGDDPSSDPWNSDDVVEATSGIDAVIDGHSHSKVPMQITKNKDGEDVVITQTGNYYQNIGEMTIGKDGSIETRLLNKDDFETLPSDEAVAADQQKWIDTVHEMLGEEIAESDIEFTVNYKNEDGSDGKRAVRSAETNMGNLNADAYYWFAQQAGLNPDIAIMNGGGIRASVPAGKWSYNDCKKVNTFDNVLCVVEMTGQTLLDALEFGARFTTGDPEKLYEYGGFLQTAGCSYRIDPTIPDTTQVNEKDVWIGGPTGKYRVHDVKVYNSETGTCEPLDLNKKYRVCGCNYILYNGGNGFDMFKNSDHVLDNIAQDYLAFADYLKAFRDTDGNGLGNLSSANSPLASLNGYLLNYENYAGSGRIVIESKEIFPDIEKDAYYAAYAEKMAKDGVIKGIDGKFCASLEMNRAMIVTMLYREAGEPEVTQSGSAVFSDVPAGSYYDKAVGWAYEKGITAGATDTAFDPKSGATREQYVTFLYRYYQKIDGAPAIAGIDGDPDSSQAVDWDKASGYSREALAWAVDAGILKGTGSKSMKLEPKTVLNRGMGVTLLGRYLELEKVKAEL